MIPMRVLMDVEHQPISTPEEDVDRLYRKDISEIAAVGVQQHGTTAELPVVIIRVNLPDGTFVLAQTTLRLFQSAAKMFTARYGDLA